MKQDLLKHWHIMCIIQPPQDHTSEHSNLYSHCYENPKSHFTWYLFIGDVHISVTPHTKEWNLWQQPIWNSKSNISYNKPGTRKSKFNKNLLHKLYPTPQSQPIYLLCHFQNLNCYSLHVIDKNVVATFHNSSTYTSMHSYSGSICQKYKILLHAKWKNHDTFCSLTSILCQNN